MARQGSRRYYEIGIKLGLNHFQITEIEQGLDSDDKKLRAIVENRRKHMEDETVLQELLDACMNIVPPIYKAVQQELQKQGEVVLQIINELICPGYINAWEDEDACQCIYNGK